MKQIDYLPCPNGEGGVAKYIKYESLAFFFNFTQLSDKKLAIVLADLLGDVVKIMILTEFCGCHTRH